MHSRNPSLSLLACVGGIVMLTSPLAAQKPTVRDTTTPAATAPATSAAQGRTHVVRRGDTLWGISKAFLNDPFRWPRIFQANRDIIANPHWIYPDQRLVIPGLAAQMAPMAQATTAAAQPSPAALAGEPVAAPPAASPGPASPRLASLRQELLAPEGPIQRTRFYPGLKGMRATPAAPHYPPVAPMEFRSASWLAPGSSVHPVGKVLRLAEPGMPTITLGNQGPRDVHPHDNLYVSYVGGQRPSVGEMLVLVRPDRRVDDWGRIWLPTALARVVEVGKDVMTVTVDHQFDNVKAGDVALTPQPVPSFGPDTAVAVQNGQKGKILAFLSDKPLHAVEDLAYVDLGRMQGLKVGDDLMAYEPAQTAGAGGENLPSQPVGKLRVVKLTDRTATVRVIAVMQPVLRSGLPVQVYKKMP